MSELRVGIIGAGGHAQSHFRMIHDEPEMALVAVADLDPERLAHTRETHGVTSLFTDYREMIEKVQLDVVYVVTFPGPLPDIVIDCLEAGLHTSVEKPPGISSDQTRRMMEAERRSSARAIVSVNRRYIPEVLAIRAMLHDRGGPVHVAATYNKPHIGDKVRDVGHLIRLDEIHMVDRVQS
ncbi:MAG: Gfo/Idh/MocA family oxidoreductase, partial [Gemmatimonadota bacterium]|nr:Gfo/Idh/MocA family oxidoreductase [Gemmatimonadota bacterium]